MLEVWSCFLKLNAYECKRKLFLAGVVDEDYRGVIKVVLFNLSDKDFEVKKGDRIAQLICERIYYPDIEEVQVVITFSNK